MCKLNLLLLYVGLLLTTPFIYGQNASDLLLPRQLEISIHNTPLAEARFDKSYIPDDKLYYESIVDSEKNLINKVLTDYIEGTANGEPERLKEAFHKDFNLYFVKNNDLAIWSGVDYINNVTPGVKNERKGKIISIDYDGDAAIAKIEIKLPSRNLTFIDYLMLLKLEGKWKIIHKSFTKRQAEHITTTY